MSKLIYVVEDDADHTVAFQRTTAYLPYEFEFFPSAEAFLAQCLKKKPHLAIVDIMLGGMSGIDLLAEIQKKEICEKVIMASTKLFDYETVVSALANGASDFIKKTPSLFDPKNEILKWKIEKVLREKSSPQSQKWLVKSLIGGVIAAVIFYLILLFENDLIQMSMAVGVIAFLVIFFYNPATRYFRAFQTIITIWAASNIIGAYSLDYIDRDHLVSFLMSPPSVAFQIITFLLMALTLLLDYRSRERC